MSWSWWCIIPVIQPKLCKKKSCPHTVDILTHWGRRTQICVGKLTTIGSDNGSSPGRRQAIIWPKAGILLIVPLGTTFSEIWIAIHTFSFKKMPLEMSSGNWLPFCLGLNVSERTLHDLWFSLTQWRHIRGKICRLFVQVMACRLNNVLTYCQLNTLERIPVKIELRSIIYTDEHPFKNAKCRHSIQASISIWVWKLLL